MNTETNRPLKWVPSAVLKSENHVEAEAAQHVVNVSTFNMNVAGDFVVVITGQNYEGNDTQTSNASDTMFVIDVDWTGYSE